MLIKSVYFLSCLCVERNVNEVRVIVLNHDDYKGVEMKRLYEDHNDVNERINEQ